MKTLLISLLFCNLFASCNAGIIQKNKKSSIVERNQSEIKQIAEQLKKKFQILSSSPYTIKYEQEYFEAFPNSFILLNSLFGYSDKAPMGGEYKPGPLSEEASTYVEAFFKLTGIEKSLYYNRIIDISLNGRWYADGVNYFQHGMKEKVKVDLNQILELLSQRSDIEIKSFWYFYFDSPHPTKQLPEELQQVKEINNRIFLLMEAALKEVQQVWKE